MPGLDLLLPFLATVAVIELTPGPNMGYLAIVSSRWGRLAGLTTVAGVTLALIVYLAASVLGTVELLVRTPWLYEAIRWLGCAYLIYLAIDTWRGAAPVRDGDQMQALHPARLFLRGFAANILNPKNALFYAVLLPGFIDPARAPPTVQAFALGLIHVGVATAIHGAIVIGAARLNPLITAAEGQDRGVRLRRVFALALAAVAAWMLWETRLA